jgi:ABC-type Fe3+-siderophore transport system permease subunit
VPLREICGGVGFPVANRLKTHMDQHRSRIVIAIFVGIALLIAVTTIVGTWRNMDQQAAAETSGN